MNIQQLEERVGSVESLVTEREKQDYTSDPAGGAALVSLKHHLAELREQLRRAMELREKEIVEITLSGASAGVGTIPLRVLGTLAQNLATTLHAASRYIKKGTHGGAIPRAVVEMLDLRLAALEAGSAKLFVTGRTAPDLFGRSLLEDSLRETFALLEAEDADKLIASVATVGISGARSVQKLATELGREGMNVALLWRTPSDEELRWSADQARLLQLAESLSAYEELRPSDLEISGEIVTLSLRERFEIKSDDGSSYLAIVPKDRIEVIKTFRVGQRATAVLKKETVRNRSTNEEKTVFSLISLMPA